MKIITFSYDDGVRQDKRLVEILNKYGLKATFNINSELLGTKNKLNIIDYKGEKICHDKLTVGEAREVYSGHEVAVHTLTHPQLTYLPNEEILRQVEKDRENLKEIFGYEIIGMAYPCAGYQNSDRVEQVIRESTGVKYARTISNSFSVAPQQNLIRYQPTTFHLDFANNYHMVDEFFASDKGGVFYVWGHSYEFDINDTWAEFEKFCEYISNREGVIYATNADAFFKYNQGVE